MFWGRIDFIKIKLVVGHFQDCFNIFATALDSFVKIIDVTGEKEAGFEFIDRCIKFVFR